MACVYGVPGAETAFLEEISYFGISRFDDVIPTLTNWKTDLKNARNLFYRALPDKIESEKARLMPLEAEIKQINCVWNNLIWCIRSADTKTFKELSYVALRLLQLPIAMVLKESKLYLTKRRVKHQKEVIYELVHNPNRVFENENKQKITDVSRLEDAIKGDNYKGAEGEVTVLRELEKLDDRFVVFCDITIDLGEYIWYGGRKNRKSAQLDFIVVGPTGVFAIEVKNWCNYTVNEKNSFPPHEQIDSAGTILYRYLKQFCHSRTPNVTKLLTALHDNMQYNPDYRCVMVRKPSGLRNFIINEKNYLSEKQIEKVKRILSG